MKIQSIKDWLSAMHTTTYKYLAIAWTTLTLYLSVVSANSIQQLDLWSIVGLDKAGHAVFYAVFAFLWMMATRDYKTSKQSIFVLAAGFGILMEIAQYLMRLGRAFEVYDILANVIGSLIGYAIYNVMTKHS